MSGTEAVNAPVVEPAAPVEGSELPAPSDEGFDALEPVYDKLLADAKGDTITIPRSELLRFKNEHAGFRTRYKPHRDAFSGMEQATQSSLLAWLSDARSEDPGVRANAWEWMSNLSKDMTPAQKADLKEEISAAASTDAAPAAGQDGGHEPQYLTRDEAQKLADERAEALFNRKSSEQEAAQNLATATRQIQTRAEELATKHDLPEMGKPGEMLYQVLLSTAQGLPTGDPMEKLEKAAEMVRDYVDKTSQRFLKAKTTAGAGSASPQGGTEPTGARKPRTLEDADKAAAERIDLALRASERVGT
jgi:hypothetical protein